MPEPGEAIWMEVAATLRCFTRRRAVKLACAFNGLGVGLFSAWERRRIGYTVVIYASPPDA